jgi:hypothetical protein
MIEDEHAVRTLVHQLMSVGRDVRSTPMHWAYEQKKTSCAISHMSWRPPWVRARGASGEDDPRFRFIGRNERVVDTVGLGRIAMVWWTQNCAYNSAYDIHRLNTTSPHAVDALRDTEDKFKQVRYNFVRDRPDLVAYIMALRAELNMRIVMPTMVPHSPDMPYLAFARFECGPGGNGHFHGASFGKGNPELGIMPCEEKPVPIISAADEAPGSDLGSSGT